MRRGRRGSSRAPFFPASVQEGPRTPLSQPHHLCITRARNAEMSVTALSPPPLDRAQRSSHLPPTVLTPSTTCRSSFWATGSQAPFLAPFRAPGTPSSPCCSHPAFPCHRARLPMPSLSSDSKSISPPPLSFASQYKALTVGLHPATTPHTGQS